MTVGADTLIVERPFTHGRRIYYLGKAIEPTDPLYNTLLSQFGDKLSRAFPAAPPGPRRRPSRAPKPNARDYLAEPIDYLA
jgi:hypothetical protein